MTLGYLAGFSETLARAVILKQGIAPLKVRLGVGCPVSACAAFWPFCSSYHSLSSLEFTEVHCSQDALVNETEDHIRAAAAWSLGQVGERSCRH
jgi:hypothetical protein